MSKHLLILNNSNSLKQQKIKEIYKIKVLQKKSKINYSSKYQRHI